MERMTAAEIERAFDGEWVLLSDPEYSEDDLVVSGVVLFHAEDVEDVDRKAVELRPRDSAVMYVGAVSDDVVYVL